MEIIINSILPVAFVIIIGATLKNIDIFNKEIWAGVQTVAYYILFPALIVKTLIGADFYTIPVFKLFTILSVGIIVYSLILLALNKPIMKWLKLDGSSYSSFFQSCTRWHTFAALAIIQGYFGNKGTAIASIAVATLVPILNIINIPVVAVFSGREEINKIILLKMVAKNPFLISCLIGIGINLGEIPLHTTLLSTLDIVSKGALGIGLLVVGSAIHFGEAMSNKMVMIIASVVKLMILPATMALGCYLLNVEGLARDIVITCGAVPTASAGVVLAKQLGGNDKMVANILSFQLIVSLVTLPSILIWLH